MKLKVYVHSLELPTTGFVDMEGARHACEQAQKTAFTGLEHFSSLFGNRYLSDEEREFLLRTDDFCKEYGLNLKIIDLGTVDFLEKLKLKIKGVTTPAICCGEKNNPSPPERRRRKRHYSVSPATVCVRAL